MSHNPVVIGKQASLICPTFPILNHILTIFYAVCSAVVLQEAAAAAEASAKQDAAAAAKKKEDDERAARVSWTRPILRGTSHGCCRAWINF
jgi:hypothetical protein